jgi:two-component system phosphate regulon sensor histidine kinase PhoR
LEGLTAKAHDSGELRAAELELTEPELRQLHVNAFSAQRTGENTRTILVFHDVTRLKELENTRRDFVANVSHELRTPLSLIKGFTETLLDGAIADEQKARQFLQTIDKHADRLSYLIDDLLTLSRLESDQLAMNQQSTDLQSLADRVYEDLQAKADKRSIRLETDIPEGLTLNVDGDRLQQAVFNLVDNAIKYGQVEGRVVIGGCATSQGMAEVAVIDDGPGIPPESVEKVFERFFRIDKARSRESGGTGLGLAIVKHIAQAHGGKVRLESELGGGSRFILCLPMAVKEEVIL